jgi:hypothetical protein
VTLEGGAELWDMVGVLVRSPGCVDRVFVGAGVQRRHRKCWRQLGWSEGIG